MIKSIVSAQLVNPELSRKSFIITMQMKWKLRDYIWTILYYNLNGGPDFVAQEMVKHGAKHCQYKGVKACSLKAKFIQLGVSSVSFILSTIYKYIYN